MSRIQEVDFSYFLFLFLFYFILDLFSFILFLELGLEGQDHAVTQQVTSGDTVTSHIIHGRMLNILEEMMLYNM